MILNLCDMKRHGIRLLTGLVVLLLLMPAGGAGASSPDSAQEKGPAGAAASGTSAAGQSLPDSVPGKEPEEKVSQPPRAVAARVNDVPIYEDDVDRLADMNFRKMKMRPTDKPSPEVQADLRKNAMQELIAVELLVQEGRKLDIPDLDERVEKSLKGKKKKPHGEQPVEGSDAAERESVRRAILVAEYLKREGITDPPISEDRIREYYEKNKEHHKRKESVHVRHILIQVKTDASPEDKAEARKKIEKARQEIIGGKDFAAVAKEYSQDNAASAGGDIGYRERGYMPEEFDAVAFTIGKNKLSDVIETKFGYHILEVLDHIQAGIPSYEEIRGFFEKYLKMEESKKRKKALVESLTAKANIVIVK